VGIATNLMVVTNRRTYNVRLTSTSGPHLERVSFLYPPQKGLSPAPLAAPSVAATSTVERRPRRVFMEEGKGTVAPVASNDSGYKIIGKADWAPRMVYHDPHHTYLQMPDNVQETPVLFLTRKGGILGLGKTKALVNYRVKSSGGHDWLVADTVIDSAVLIAGTGSGRQEVRIQRVN